MLSKQNFAVILSLNDKWVVKTLKSGSYCMINCEETRNDIFLKFPVFGMVDFKLMLYLKLIGASYQPFSPPPPPPPFSNNCWVSYYWLVGGAKREENDISIAKRCIPKAAGSGIHEMIFPSSNWTYLLTRTLQIVCAVYHKYANLFLSICQKFLESKCM